MEISLQARYISLLFANAGKTKCIDLFLQLVALKAELLTKQAQIEKARAAGIKVIHRGRENKKIKEPEQKNSGVELRAKKDEEEKREEERSLFEQQRKLDKDKALDAIRTDR